MSSSQGVLDQIQAHLEGEVETSAFYQPFLDLEDRKDLTKATQDKLKLQASTTIAAAMRPALQNLSQFLVTEYLPACRPQVTVMASLSGQNPDVVLRSVPPPCPVACSTPPVSVSTPPRT